MEKIGIKAFIHEFTRPIKNNDDDDVGFVKMVNNFKVVPCYVRICDHTNGSFFLEFVNDRNLRISETDYYESGVEETMENDSSCGFYFKPNDIVKFITIIFANDTSITYDLQNETSFNDFYRNMKTYIDSGYTKLPIKSSLEKAADLLADDEFDDI